MDQNIDRSSAERDGGESKPSLRVLCAAAEVQPDQPARAELDGVAYAVFCVGGSYFVTADLCTHGPGCLSEGYVDGGEVECPFHGGRFNIASGRPTAPPCTEAVRTWTAHLIDGQICIDPTEAAR